MDTVGCFSIGIATKVPMQTYNGKQNTVPYGSRLCKPQNPAVSALVFMDITRLEL